MLFVVMQARAVTIAFQKWQASECFPFAVPDWNPIDLSCPVACSHEQVSNRSCERQCGDSRRHRVIKVCVNTFDCGEGERQAPRLPATRRMRARESRLRQVWIQSECCPDSPGRQIRFRKRRPRLWKSACQYCWPCCQWWDLRASCQNSSPD